MRRSLLLALCCLAGCHYYVPAPDPAPTAGASMRVLLTDQGTVDMAPQVGRSIGTLDGTLVSRDSASTVLSMHMTYRRDGVDDEVWKGEHVKVPNSDIANLQLRKLSVSRTAMFSVGMAALATAVGLGFSGAGGIFGNHGGNPGGQQ